MTASRTATQVLTARQLDLIQLVATQARSHTESRIGDEIANTLEAVLKAGISGAVPVLQASDLQLLKRRLMRLAYHLRTNAMESTAERVERLVELVQHWHRRTN